MLELILVIFAAMWFAKEARSIGKSGILWALIGVFGFYIPVIVMGSFIFPSIFGGYITPENYLLFLILSIVLNLCVGVGSLFLIRNYLLRKTEELIEKEKAELKEREAMRIKLDNIKNIDQTIGQKAYDAQTQNYIGVITEVDSKNREIKVEGDFDGIQTYVFNNVLVNPL